MVWSPGFQPAGHLRTWVAAATGDQTLVGLVVVVLVGTGMGRLQGPGVWLQGVACPRGRALVEHASPMCCAHHSACSPILNTHTSSGLFWMYWMACSTRLVSSTLRPKPRLLMVECCRGEAGVVEVS